MSTPKLGRTLRELRRKRGLKQWEVANFLQLSQPAICQLERGIRDPSLDQLTKLAKLFGVRRSRLLAAQEGGG